MTPGEFNHPAAHAGVACFGEASLASSLAALVWSSSEAGVARQSPTVPDLAREHLLDEHVCGLDPDGDNSGKRTRRRMASPLWRLRQTLGAGLLDLVDPPLDEAQAVQVTSHLGQCVGRYGEFRDVYRNDILQPRVVALFLSRLARASSSFGG